MAGTEPVFIDSNVLLYRHDLRDTAKFERAVVVTRQLAHQARGVISMQVVSEYANVLTGKFSRFVDMSTVPERIDALMSDFETVPVAGNAVRLALEGRERWGLPYYDAQIWAAARLAGATILLSEDFADGATLDGVRVLDPFAEDFGLAMLG